MKSTPSQRWSSLPQLLSPWSSPYGCTVSELAPAWAPWPLNGGNISLKALKTEPAQADPGNTCPQVAAGGSKKDQNNESSDAQLSFAVEEVNWFAQVKNPPVNNLAARDSKVGSDCNSEVN